LLLLVVLLLVLVLLLVVLVEWCSGGVVEWCSGGVVEWWSGGVWWSGGRLARGPSGHVPRADSAIYKRSTLPKSLHVACLEF
jgi:hypothetical protein